MCPRLTWVLLLCLYVCMCVPVPVSLCVFPSACFSLHVFVAVRQLRGFSPYFLSFAHATQRFPGVYGKQRPGAGVGPQLSRPGL